MGGYDNKLRQLLRIWKLSEISVRRCSVCVTTKKQYKIQFWWDSKMLKSLTRSQKTWIQFLVLSLSAREQSAGHKPSLPHSSHL